MGYFNGASVLSMKKTDDAWSLVFEINFGVRQDSVLSPFLFAVYLNGLSKLCSTKNCAIVLYADDIMLLSSSVTHSLKCSLDESKKKLYRAANGIFGKIGRVASEEVILHVISSKMFAYPLLWFRKSSIISVSVKLT